MTLNSLLHRPPLLWCEQQHAHPKFSYAVSFPNGFHDSHLRMRLRAEQQMSQLVCDDRT